MIDSDSRLTESSRSQLKNADSVHLSVVLTTPDCYETIRNTVACLRKQSAARRLEIVIVAPSRSELSLNESELSEFFNFRVVEVGKIQSIGTANAAGVRHARAPIVALAEDHSCPDPDWAQALIEAHQSNWAAVGPVVRNANPSSTISQADFLIGYGCWMEGVPSGVMEHLPGHNSSYKRSVLLDYGPELEAMLEAETVLHWDMNNKGHLLYLESGARISHLNFGTVASWLQAQFYSARVFAAIRSRRWSAAQRLVYALAAPLIPGVRVWRILRQSHQCSRKLKLSILPTLVFGLTVSALGEMTAYALGAGQARKRLTHFEFHRIRHVGAGTWPRGTPAPLPALPNGLHRSGREQHP